MTLPQLFTKYGSDKDPKGHDYGKFYMDIIPPDVHSILEIGVLGGASIQAYGEYYPNCKIYGMDLFTEYPIPSIDGVEWFKGNQLDHDLLYHIRNDIRPQVIIEDASHNCIDHWVTMFSLISSCQIYFIEDLHTCNESFYRQGLTFEQTVLGSMINNTFPFKFILRNDHKIAAIYANTPPLPH